VPAQQRSGRHQPELALWGRLQPAQRAEYGAVKPGQRWPGVGAAQHGDLVPQHDDLDVLGGVGAGEQRQPAQHANEKQVGKSEGHSGDHAGLARDDDVQWRTSFHLHMVKWRT